MSTVSLFIDGLAKALAFAPNKFDEALENHYEPQLQQRGLGKDQINRKTLPELQSALAEVDKAIAEYTAFGSVRLKVSANGEVAVSPTDEGVPTDVRHVLLGRKKQILERINTLKGAEDVRSLRSLVEKDVPTDKQPELLTRLAALEHQTQISVAAVKAVEEERTRVAAEWTAKEAAMALLERRAKVWQSFLAKESVATLVGSLVLIVLCGVVVTAMFMQIETSSIVSNAFLVLLGYFFGQTTAKAST